MTGVYIKGNAVLKFPTRYYLPRYSWQHYAISLSYKVSQIFLSYLLMQDGRSSACRGYGNDEIMVSVSSIPCPSGCITGSLQEGRVNCVAT